MFLSHMHMRKMSHESFVHLIFFFSPPVLNLSFVLVESIPEHMRLKENVTLGLPLELAWKQLISMATKQVDLVSFYWTLTGDDIGVNSSSDLPVRGPQTHSHTKNTTHTWWVKAVNVNTFVCLHFRDETS